MMIKRILESLLLMMLPPEPKIGDVQLVAHARSFASQRGLFEYQVAIYTTLGLATHDELLPLSALIPETGIFLVVPPWSKSGGELTLLRFIRHGDSIGGSSLASQDLKDLVETPIPPYIIVDIEDGRKLLNLSPARAEVELRNQQRSPLVTAEGLVYAMLFPSTLWSHGMFLSGSRYQQKYVPILYSLREEGEQAGSDFHGPIESAASLGRASADDVDSKCGTPSCVTRRHL